MKTGFVFASVVLLSIAVAQQPEAPVTKGTIYGTVIDQDGQPAKEIGLTAYPLGVAPGAVLPHTKTDQNGDFRFCQHPLVG
jgi:hypothetical protein